MRALLLSVFLCLFCVPVCAEELLADSILVEKAKRTMTLFHDEMAIRIYTISLGKRPVGPKRQQGDFKTPEGHYFINGRKLNSEYHLALQISYPDELDKERARARGVDAGDRVMIHGRPADFGIRHRRKRDWTFGCIAVTNPEIEEIWRLVPDGTPIEIRP